MALSVTSSRTLQYGIRFLYEANNQPVRGAAVGIASRTGNGWSAITWMATDGRGDATFPIPGRGQYRLTTTIRGRRQDGVVDVQYSYQTNRLWVRSDGTLRVERFVP